jgi:hypothetical protein
VAVVAAAAALLRPEASRSSYDEGVGRADAGPVCSKVVYRVYRPSLIGI